MDTLTLRDISPQAIQEQSEILSRCDEELRTLNEEAAAIQERIAVLTARRTEVLHGLSWRRLMAEVEAPDSKTAAVSASLEEAVGHFKRSLATPPGYEAEEEDGVLVSYSDTDDYADFSAVEREVDNILDDVRAALVSASAQTPDSSKVRSRSISMSSSEALASPSGGAATPAEKALARRGALLQLLVLSLYTGRLEQHCDFSAIRDTSNIPAGDAEEVREEVAALWHWCLRESTVLTAGERAEWEEILRVYVGHPFAISD